MPPAHVHRRTHEQFLVLKGELTLFGGDERLTLRPGECALIPPGVSHRFANEADWPCRFLVTLSPGGPERYSPGLAEFIADSPDWPPTGPAMHERLAAHAAAHDMFPPIEGA